MAQPYVGEIRMFAGNFAPAGWMFCSGQLLPISENETIYSLIGSTYGGDGESTFALPDLQSRVPIHWGNGFTLAESGGAEEVTLTVQQIPVHNHTLLATLNQATQNPPNSEVVAQLVSQNAFAYGTDVPPATLAPQTVGTVGGSQPHSNLQPFLCVNFIISLFGIFPSPT